MNNINVLITSVGVSSAINVIKSLRLQKELNVKIIGVDVDGYAAGLHLVDTCYISPPVIETKAYLEFLFGICLRHRVQVLYPCYSKEIELISRHQDDFRKIGVEVLISSVETIRLCNNKIKITKFVKELN